MELFKLSDIKSLINKLSTKLETFVTRMSKSEVFEKWNEVGEVVEQDDDTGVISMSYPTESGKKLNITITPTETEDKYDVLFELDSKYMAELKSASWSDYERKFEQLINQLELIPNLTANKKLILELSKITGNSYIDIKLHGIKANYDNTDVIEDVNNIVNADNIEDIILEEPQIYEFDIEDTSNDTGYSIIELEPVEDLTYNAIKCLAQTSFNLMMYLWSIHWNVIGDKFYDIHNLLDKYNEKLSDEFDYFQELLSEKYGETVNVLDCKDNPEYQLFTAPIKGDEALPYIVHGINAYLISFDVYKYNLDDSNVALINDWYRYWDKEANYMLNHYANS